MSDDTLFLDYVDAVDRGETPDIATYCAKAENPTALRENIKLHGSLGMRIGRFQVIEELGKGGFGSVFLALDPELGRQVAIKVMSGKEWARNEARSLARLRHPHIVEVYEIEDDFIVMEYINGKPLESTGPPHERLKTLIQLADAVAYAHGEGVLSRDIKPDNVLINREGDVKLIDFSIAHIDGDETDLNITTSLVASPAYLAPEQIESETTGASPHSDQFSLGIVAYEFLTGQHPFRQSRMTRSQLLNAISLCAPAKPPGLARDLQNVILKTLEPDPSKRYPTVDAFRDDLKAVLELRPVSVSRVNPLRVLRRYRKLITLIVALIFVATIPLVVRHMTRLNALRSMPLATSMEVEAALSELRSLPDERTAQRIQKRFDDASETDQWALAAWTFRQLTGKPTAINHGRVFAPAGAQFERQLETHVFEPIEYSDDVPFGTGYYRCNGQEFRKVSMWDPPIYIEEHPRDTSGAKIINGVFATDVILDEYCVPLSLTSDQALAYAAARGGRLPTIAELLRMKIQSGISSGEWTANCSPLSMQVNGQSVPNYGHIDSDPFYHYKRAKADLELDPLNPASVSLVGRMFLRKNPPFHKDSKAVGPTVCFRIVFPTNE